MKFILPIIFFLGLQWCAAQPDTSGKIKFEIPAGKSAIFVELQPSYYEADTNCNCVRYSPFENDETANFLQRNFACYRILMGDSSESALFKLRGTSILPAFYLIDDDQNLLGFTSGPDKSLHDFELMRDSAAVKLQRLKELEQYRARADQNLLNKDELRSYIEKRLKLNLLDNGLLIEKFAKMMSDEDLQDPEVMLLIYKSGYIFDGLAHRQLFKNRELSKKVFQDHHKKYTPTFFKRMLTNSINLAVKQKNSEFAERIAKMYESETSGNKRSASSPHPWVMMTYYRGVKDTTNYLKNLLATYEPMLEISKDSAARYEKKRASRSHQAIPDEDDLARVIRGDFYSSHLEGAARQISEHTHDPFFLAKGISFCRHALLLQENYYPIRLTLSKLLAASGFSNEAKKEYQKYISKGNFSSHYLERLQTEFNKMSNANME